jgi:MFS family permease
MTLDDANQLPPKVPSFFYGYIVVAVAFLIMVVSWGLYFVFGVFFNPILEEFGWTRAMTSGAFSISSVLQGVLGIAMGGLTDRFGPRVVVTFCGAFLGLGYLLMSQIDTLWQLYLFYGVIIGTAMGGLWVPLLSSVARWFTGRRSLMTGIVVSGLTIGQLFAPPVVNWLITTYGWRLSFIILGSITLIAVVSAAQFLRRNPSQMGQFSNSENEGKEEGLISDTKAFTLREAIQTTQFWLVSITVFCFGYGAFAITVHIVPHVTELGISAESAANILAVNGGVGIFGNFVLGGIMGDRIGNRNAFVVGFVLMVASLFWLVFVREIVMLYLFAIVFGLALGSMGTSESPLIASLFGLRSHGMIYGVVGLGFTAGGAVGPVMSGYLFDLKGDYQLAFLSCTMLGVVGLISVSILRPTKKLE